MICPKKIYKEGWGAFRCDVDCKTSDSCEDCPCNEFKYQDIKRKNNEYIIRTIVSYK